jgi:hypothetical protein
MLSLYIGKFMSVLLQVLLEEKERLEKNIFAYEEKLKQLPKGSIVVRKIRDHFFVYRTIRVDQKIKSLYLGKKGLPFVEEQILLRSEVKRIKSNLKIAMSEYLKLKKALKAYERK